MNPATAQALVLVDELARCGVREAVIAPGSRSAPLALALYEDRRVRLHVRIDERSAGFLAVGMASVSGRPVALVCTSGTAAANFHPAVLEASAARVPLVVLTADRPPELRQTGASQTIDQIKLYGSAVRFFAEVGVAESRPGQVTYWRSVACRACATAVGGTAAGGGPVHLNIPFREPLIDDQPRQDGDSGWIEPLDGRPDGSPWTRVGTQRPRPVEGALPPAWPSVEGALAPTRLEQGALLPEMAERGAVVVGDGPVDAGAAVALAEACGWPILAEPTGNARHGENAISTYPLLLAHGDFARAHRPELVVTVGKPGLSRSLMSWLQAADHHVVVDAHAEWADPARTAAIVLPAVPVPPERREPAGWLRSWQVADKAAAAAIDAVLDESPALNEPQLARDLAAAAPGGSLLFVASSKPIRDLELVMQPREGLRIVANRGVNGIDGLVSSAMGAALAWQDDHEGEPAGGSAGHAYALLGDLAYLHDRNGLVLDPDEPRPDLTIVVVDNRGGGIFSLLPQADVGGFERVFGTPHALDIAGDAAAAGIDVLQPRSRNDLRSALEPGKGLRVVHVKTHRAAATMLHQRLEEAVASAIADRFG
jgi:2-succinyl-5-enolpyruvyl-6-hydroxy-3-cyclohexene-1-carboxylate synthase